MLFYILDFSNIKFFHLLRIKLKETDLQISICQTLYKITVIFPCHNFGRNSTGMLFPSRKIKWFTLNEKKSLFKINAPAMIA